MAAPEPQGGPIIPAPPPAAAQPPSYSNFIDSLRNDVQYITDQTETDLSKIENNVVKTQQSLLAIPSGIANNIFG